MDDTDPTYGMTLAAKLLFLAKAHKAGGFGKYGSHAAAKAYQAANLAATKDHAATLALVAAVAAPDPAPCVHGMGATCKGFGLDDCYCSTCGAPVRSTVVGDKDPGGAGWVDKAQPLPGPLAKCGAYFLHGGHAMIAGQGWCAGNVDVVAGL